MMVVRTKSFHFGVYLVVYLLGDCFFMRVQPANTEEKGFAVKDALDFMKRFGYLQDDKGGPQALLDSESMMKSALKKVQWFGGLPQTGLLDEATIKLMKADRCGVPDIITSKRGKRDTPYSNVWNKGVITYFVGETFPIAKDLARIELKDAFDLWAIYSRLKFVEIADEKTADIVILFGSRDHGDRFPFDGKGQVLAHAFPPSDYHGLSGDIHFDNDELWVIDPKQSGGTDFFSVAIHEIGHSLGFDHSNNRESVMYNTYAAYDKKSFQFTRDIINALYGMYILNRNINWSAHSNPNIPSTTATSRTRWTPYTTRRTPYTTRRTTYTTQMSRNTYSPPSNPTPRTSTDNIISFEGDYESVETHKEHDMTHNVPKKIDPVLKCKRDIPSSPPDFCAGNFDSVVNLRGQLYFFKKGYMQRMKDRGDPYGGPQQYQYTFFRNKTSEMLNCMDAIYERPSDHNFVIFTGSVYWVFDDNMNMLDNSPQPLTNYGLSSYVPKIDAAMVLNGKTYLFQNRKYWRYDDMKKKLDDGYPKPINFFLGLPHNIDAAFTWTDKNTYFFKGNQFWRFNSTWKKVGSVNGLTAPKYWLNCDG